jgi:hypothetical protein
MIPAKFVLLRPKIQTWAIRGMGAAQSPLVCDAAARYMFNLRRSPFI